MRKSYFWEIKMHVDHIQKYRLIFHELEKWILTLGLKTLRKDVADILVGKKSLEEGEEASEDELLEIFILTQILLDRIESAQVVGFTTITEEVADLVNNKIKELKGAIHAERYDFGRYSRFNAFNGLGRQISS